MNCSVPIETNVHVNEIKGSVFDVSPGFVNIVSKPCLVKCDIEGHCCEALWETGAQVSLVHINYIKRFLPLLVSQIENVSNVLDANFSLSSASGNNIPIEGILYLNVALSDQVLKVPFLVANDYVSGLSEPILGYNVIQCM